MVDYSDVQIIYDDDIDITNHAVIARARFNSSAGAIAGDCDIELRDINRELTFISGRRLKLLVDGVQMWSGFNLINGKTSFFPAGDGLEQTTARKFVLRGADNNRLLDFRTLRYPANYLKAVPNITTNRFDGDILKEALTELFDMPSWLDLETFIDDVAVPTGTDITAAEPWAYPEQGSKLRALFDDLARWSAAVFYIGPDDAVHYHSLQNVENSWGFSDRPNHGAITGTTGFENAYWGFRELMADEDGSGIITDAFVWGGSPYAGSGATVFKRATDEDQEDIYGKWQLAEVHFNETNFKTQKTVNQRGNMIVFGNPSGDPSGAEPGSVVGEGPRGLRFPQFQFSFAWHTKDVPTLAGVPAHLYPGDIVPIQLWAYSEDDGATPFTKFLPLRSAAISFPTGAQNGQAVVNFSGLFDLRNEDSKFLWKYLRRREPQIASTAPAAAQLPVVTDDSTGSTLGAGGKFIPTPVPNDVQTTFTIPVGYIPGSSMFYKNGLALRPGEDYDYVESDSEAGTFTLAVPPATGDQLYVTVTTLTGTISSPPPTPPPSAGSKYIAPGGSDTTGDGSLALPWRTIQKFVSLSAAGDILYCRGGTYAAGTQPEISTTGHSGTSGNEIQITNYPGEIPTFVSPEIYFEGGSSYWILNGITITGSIAGSAAHVWIGNGRSVPGATYTHHITIRNCSITKSGGAVTAHGIYLSHMVEDTLIEDNLIVGKSATLPEDRCAGIHIFHGVNPDETATRTVARRNVIRRWPKGIVMWDEAGEPGNGGVPTATASFLHNTFMQCDFHIDNRWHAAVLIRDNVGDNSISYDIYDPNDAAATTADHNYWSQTLTSSGALTAGSPAINGALDGSDAGAIPYP